VGILRSAIRYLKFESQKPGAGAGTGTVSKLKDKAFARSVSRQDIYDGAAELGVDLTEHVAFVREALLPIAAEIGVSGPG